LLAKFSSKCNPDFLVSSEKAGSTAEIHPVSEKCLALTTTTEVTFTKSHGANLEHGVG